MNEDTFNRPTGFDKMLERQNITKFGKAEVEPPPTVISLVDDIREHCKKVMELCDKMAEVANSSEDNARKAADHLLDMLKRFK